MKKLLLAIFISVAVAIASISKAEVSLNSVRVLAQDAETAQANPGAQIVIMQDANRCLLAIPE